MSTLTQEMAEIGIALDMPLASSTSYERVHAAMLSDIISGAIKPGERLKSAELAERYRVSQMPVREAIQRLQGEGLVTLTPNYGARVRSFDSTFIAELYELRAELHAFSHRTIFSDWDPALPDKLTAIQGTYDEALNRGDAAACQVANINFHDPVNKRCTNSEVMRILQSQEHLVRTMRSALGYSTKRLREQASEHWLLIHAIRRRDMVGAMAIAREHAINAGADVIELFEAARSSRTGGL